MPLGSSAARAAAAVASRVAAAVLGSLALAAATTVLLSFVLPPPRAEAVMGATLLSFLVMTLGAVWAFAARSALAAWSGLLLPSLALAAWAAVLWAGGP